MTKLYDAFGQEIQTKKLADEVAGATNGGIRNFWSEHPSVGATPERIAQLLQAAEQGDETAWLELAEDMEEKDCHYRAVLSTRKLQVSGLEMQVEAFSDEPRDQEAADLVRTILPIIRPALFDILDAIGKGFSVTEIFWNTQSKQWKPVDLVWRDPRWFTFDAQTGRGPLLRMEDGSLRDLEPGKFIVHYSKSKSGLPMRSGLARVAVWTWLFKNFDLKSWIIFTEIYGIPLRLGKYGAEASEKDRRALWRAVSQIAADHAAIVPSSMEIQFLEGGKQSGGSVFKELAEYLDMQISKLVLGQTGTTDTGSRVGTADAHERVRADIERSDAEQLAASLNKYLVAPLIALNFGAECPLPQIKIFRRETKDLTVMGDFLSKMIPFGLKVGASTVADFAGFPDPDPQEKCLEMPASVNFADSQRNTDFTDRTDRTDRQTDREKEEKEKEKELEKKNPISFFEQIVYHGLLPEVESDEPTVTFFEFDEQDLLTPAQEVTDDIIELLRALSALCNSSDQARNAQMFAYMLEVLPALIPARKLLTILRGDLFAEAVKARYDFCQTNHLPNLQGVEELSGSVWHSFKNWLVTTFEPATKSSNLRKIRVPRTKPVKEDPNDLTSRVSGEEWFPIIPDKTAIESLARRGLKMTETYGWTQLWQETHQRTFTVAQSAGFDILQDIHDELLKAMTEGGSLTTFIANLEPVLKKKGWWGVQYVPGPNGRKRSVELGSPRRLAIIWDANIHVAQAQSEWAMQEQTKSFRPYLRYTAVMDSRTRPQHAAWHGTILPADHDWWNTHYPPNGWRCRCKVLSLNKTDMEAEGWQESDVPKATYRNWYYRDRNGRRVWGGVIEEGLDPGWNYHPGKLDKSANLMGQKMSGALKMSSDVLLASLAYSFPQYKERFQQWLADLSEGKPTFLADQVDFYASASERMAIVGALNEDVQKYLIGRTLDDTAKQWIALSEEDVLRLLQPQTGTSTSVQTLSHLPETLNYPEGIFWNKDNFNIYLYRRSTMAGEPQYYLAEVNLGKNLFFDGRPTVLSFREADAQTIANLQNNLRRLPTNGVPRNFQDLFLEVDAQFNSELSAVERNEWLQTADGILLKMRPQYKFVDENGTEITSFEVPVAESGGIDWAKEIKSAQYREAFNAINTRIKQLAAENQMDASALNDSFWTSYRKISDALPEVHHPNADFWARSRFWNEVKRAPEDAVDLWFKEYQADPKQVHADFWLVYRGPRVRRRTSLTYNEIEKLKSIGALPKDYYERMLKKNLDADYIENLLHKIYKMKKEDDNG